MGAAPSKPDPDGRWTANAACTLGHIPDSGEDDNNTDDDDDARTTTRNNMDTHDVDVSSSVSSRPARRKRARGYGP